MNTIEDQFTFVNRNTNFENINEYDLFVNGSKRLVTKDKNETPFTVGYSEFISTFFDTKKYIIFLQKEKINLKKIKLLQKIAQKICVLKNTLKLQGVNMSDYKEAADTYLRFQ